MHRTITSTLLVLLLFAFTIPASARSTVLRHPSPPPGEIPALPGAEADLQAAEGSTVSLYDPFLESFFVAGLASPTFSCGYSPQIDQLLRKTSASTWLNTISRLSGATPVTVGGQTATLNNRYSPHLFNGQSRAFDYLKEQILALYPAEQVEEDPYNVYHDNEYQTWKNLILTLPGQVYPDQVVILSAHFDSTSGQVKPTPPAPPVAPGADDNASGATTLLEAARILRGQRFERTIRLVWFTGEELGLKGSIAYANDHITDPSKIVGVINLDMYAYDGNQDRCFELHVGKLPQSDAVGQCIANSISAYQLNLKYDYLTGEDATRASDHAVFWDRSIGAVEVGENFFIKSSPGGCVGSDMNPEYHKVSDTVANLTQNSPGTFGFDIHRAALAALMSMAVRIDPINIYIPFVTSE